ncbi:DUF2264 domain-containing protein [Halalkalibacter urbisdiaboli]|uniref:DUF2264 domain-containing protein n=1 Tax=Halalkalibacter urbisdiaboli TaxID=1960589 RepID=UPI000B44E633|nr:DUF2264 domain-containing protein [Halalkalibacter urbisdiaboli]
MQNFDLPIYQNPLNTRGDLRAAIEQICKPLEPFFSKGYTRLHIGNTSSGCPDPVAGMEGFSRLLWGIVPYIAGGKEYDGWEKILQGIKNGVDPTHEEYWGDIHDYDQRIVEMAVYGFALALIPEKIWEPLNEQEKKNLATWLNQINEHKSHDCNWLLFQVLVNIGLKKVGASYNQEVMEKHLNRIEDFYLSDGWYSDGVNTHCDYYTSFAIHYYCLFYAKLMEDDDPVRSHLYKKRASVFAQDFIYWFAKDGSALPYGRSLTYRFSQAAFWSAVVFAEVEPFPPGVIKGLLLNHVRWWFKQPIFNADGTLSIGYAYPNLIMAENYNAPGSPYWGLKTFLIVALKEEHPFWQAEEQPLPPLKEMSVQHAPHLVICRQEETGHILAFNSGHKGTNDHTHTSAKYEKFVYSNYFGFSVPRAEWGLGQGAFDSMLALSEGDNLYRVKRRVEEYSIEGNIIYTKWKPWNDVIIKTWLIVGAPWHVRVHHIKTKRSLNTADGGFALGKGKDNFVVEEMETIQNDGEVIAKNSLGESGIKSLYGNSTAQLIHPNANTNIMNSQTVIPTLQGKLKPGTHWLVSAVFGEPSSETSTNEWENAPRVEIINNELNVLTADRNKILFSNVMK